MKKLLALALVMAATSASAQGPAATPPISAPATGGVVTTPAAPAPADLLKRAKALPKASDRRAVLDLLKAKKFAEADSTITALDAEVASAAAGKEIDAEVAKAFAAEADSVQRAHDAELRKLSKAECVDWAAAGATPPEVALRQEALRVRWHVAAYPKSLGPDGRAAWLVARGGPSGGGGSDPEVASLRKEVATLRANTIAAVRQNTAEVAGLRGAVVAAGVVSDAQVAAAVDEMLRTTRLSFDSGDETSPTPTDGARIVLKAGD